MSEIPVRPDPDGPILRLQDVSKSYGAVRAVRDISLAIPPGAIYGFLGPNGAGKTTTIRSIMGIILPDSGTISFRGQPLGRNTLDRIGYLPEERGLYRKMKCAEHLGFLGELKGLPRREALSRAREWLERLDLAEWGDRKVDALSKGMQQKVQFAATFLFEPELVILDEPFSGLDPLNIELLRDVIVEQRARGCTVIFSTHMLAEAEKLCDSICLIDGGLKILDGSLDEVRRSFPLKSVRVAFAADVEPPADLPGVIGRTRAEGEWRLEIDQDTDTRALLTALAAAGPVSLFSANRPTLDEIFLAAVRRRRGAGAAPGEARA